MVDGEKVSVNDEKQIKIKEAILKRIAYCPKYKVFYE